MMLHWHCGIWHRLLRAQVWWSMLVVQITDSNKFIWLMTQVIRDNLTMWDGIHSSDYDYWYHQIYKESHSVVLVLGDSDLQQLSPNTVPWARLSYWFSAYSLKACTCIKCSAQISVRYACYVQENWVAEFRTPNEQVEKCGITKSKLLLIRKLGHLTGY